MTLNEVYEHGLVSPTTSLEEIEALAWGDGCSCAETMNEVLRYLSFRNQYEPRKSTLKPYKILQAWDAYVADFFERDGLSLADSDTVVTASPEEMRSIRDGLRGANNNPEVRK